MFGMEFHLDPSRCIGCRSCMQACAECDTHRGVTMIHVDELDRENGIETTPMVCMHCLEPTCAKVCPADAIKQNEDGIVHSALDPRCIACRNCEQACPFGVPKVFTGKMQIDEMMKCDMCWDRTSIGKRPMCATVCPSQALAYVRPEEIAATRREKPITEFQFGRETVRTKVRLMVPEGTKSLALDAADFIWESKERS
jgi:Fe-S-cluster-containing dehydrogenase component